MCGAGFNQLKFAVKLGQRNLIQLATTVLDRKIVLFTQVTIKCIETHADNCTAVYTSTKITQKICIMFDIQ